MERRWLKYFFISGVVILLATSGWFVWERRDNGNFEDEIYYSQLGKNLIPEQRVSWIASLKKYNQEFKTNPRDYGILMKLGWYRYELGDIDGSIKAYTSAGEVSPHNFSSFHELGQRYLYKGEYQKADEAFKTALKNDPQKGYLYRNLVDLYNQHLPENKPQLEKILKDGLLALGNENNLDVMMLLTTYYESVGNKKSALEMVKRMLSVDAKNQFALEAKIRLK